MTRMRSTDGEDTGVLFRGGATRCNLRCEVACNAALAPEIATLGNGRHKHGSRELVGGKKAFCATADKVSGNFFFDNHGRVLVVKLR